MAMACEPVSTLDCNNLCTANPATGLTVQIVAGRVTISDTTLIIEAPSTGFTIPCAGFGLWTGCQGGRKEIFFWGSVSQNNDGTYTLAQLVRGLAYSGCEIVSDPDLIREHTRSEELILADSSIHYYNCKLCECLSDLKSRYQCLVDSAGQLNPDAELGDKCTVWNNGKPVEYTFGNIGGGNLAWRANFSAATTGSESVSGSLGLVCPPTNPSFPQAYGRGCDTIDEFYDNTALCGVGLKYSGAFVADEGNSVNHIYGNNIVPVTVVDPNLALVNQTIANFPFTPLVASEALVTVVINKSSRAVDTYGADISEAYYFEVFDTNTLVAIYTSPIRRSGPNQVTALVPVASFYGTETLLGTSGILTPGTPYEIRVYGNITSGGSDWHGIDYDNTSMHLILNPVC